VKSKQWVLLAAGIVLTACLFLFAETKPPKKDAAAMPPIASGNSSTSVNIDFTSILTKARTTLNASQVDSISGLELQLKKVRGEKEKERMLSTIANTWEKTGNVLVAGEYYSQAAEINNDKILLEKAGDLFYTGFPTTSDSMARIFGAQQGVKTYSQLSKMDSANYTYQIREAVCYIDGLGNVMQGVSILKGVEAKDPDNKQMNLILGSLAVVSGQYDKAITRLEKLIKLDPENAEAYYHLAEAYQAVGRKEDAIKSLEQCKKLVNDPAFSAQIDSYIQQIKKP